ncbi:Biotin carboxyl carrier protein of acetyl-CoA carboxylase [Hyella patelloides LEGE 07179]|uniref:Biotin carboxyl carrier protein of acetyl-CoA carboxylase n=1 Tax=Hyella patelloides LEGE 07179 TaxID=945734 RepID=A0A563VMR1_9CYAN|nr:acetyl-CoA carboxylase biotin carboxyl carrier protein [Hyella patelloides]VEP12623.1 Biotin carboxyl carrier protein of acetyl-CoA carboxylase [Hyella patelloides LEGE 07179]
MSVDFQQLRELIGAIANTDITELTLKSDDFELQVKKGSVASNQELVDSVPDTIPTPIQPTAITPVATPPTTPVSEPTSPLAEQQKWVEITSPMVGTFYRAPTPDEPPFVDVGELISKGDTVCIIEAMKLMNDIDAEVSGEIMEIVVQNGEPVEFGQVLMRVNPGN